MSFELLMILSGTSLILTLYFNSKITWKQFYSTEGSTIFW